MSTHKYLDETGLGQVWGKIKDLIPESDVFWINVTSTTVDDVTTYSADKTFAEITAAHSSGKECILVNGQYVYNLEYVYSNYVAFTTTSITGTPLQRVTNKSLKIDNSNVVSIIDAPFLTSTGSNNAYPKKDLVAQVNGNFNTTTTTGNLTYSTTAYRAYNKGDLFWLSNTVLARATTDIASGATLTENTNYVKTTIENELKEKANVLDVLIKTNTTSYTPTSDYNPATKKYVDDATASITDEKLSTGTIGNNVYYPIVGTNTSSATTKYIDSTGFKYDATSSTNGYARLYLGNGTVSGTTGSKYGRLMIYGTTAYGVTLDSGSPTENRTISLPNKNGTIALTSDIQTCATMAEIEEMCAALGILTLVVDTDDYESAE